MSADRGVSLGVMARAPIPGRCKTRLAAALGVERATAVYRAMLLDSLDVFERVGAGRLVVMAAPEDSGAAVLRALVPASWEVVPQEGEGLGARLAHAFRELGKDGHPVALVDSDSPTVSSAPIAAAFATFAGPRRALMGPCEDGGYYLIALTTLELGVLRGVPWSTPAVATRTRANCALLGLDLRELPEAYDVDEPKDLARLEDELTRHPERAPRTARELRRP